MMTRTMKYMFDTTEVNRRNIDEAMKVTRFMLHTRMKGGRTNGGLMIYSFARNTRKTNGTQAVHGLASPNGTG